jgi:hypothetical protein
LGNPINLVDPFGLEVDLQEMVDWLDSHANKKSKGQCAKYVRQGLEAGGADTTGHPIYAKEYGPTLINNGFQPIPSQNYTPKLGDIVVFQPLPGAPPNRRAGHIQAYDGENWVSDYLQPRFKPNQNQNPQYQIYRQPEE